jgi:hypothetical protein
MLPRNELKLECTRAYFKQLTNTQTHIALAKQYKNKVFWDIDLELSVWGNQPTKHRYEYSSAITIFRRYQYMCLVEKYGGHGQETHSVKRYMVEKVAGAEVARILGATGVNKIQCPDLFVFVEDMSDWCFVEVKGPGDKVRPEQIDSFNKLSSLTGKPWYLAQVTLVSP